MGLFRGSKVWSTSASLSLSASGSCGSFDNNANDENTGTLISKELLEMYGSRLEATKSSLAAATRRVVHDPTEFSLLQQQLRQGRGLLTDAWTKQNLCGLMHKHARACETRKAAAALREVASPVPCKSNDNSTTMSTSFTLSSPTSIMHSLSLDAASVKEHVGSPPLAIHDTTAVAAAPEIPPPTTSSLWRQVVASS